MFFSPFVSQHTKALGGRYRVYIAPAHILLIKNGENGCWNVLFILSISLCVRAEARQHGVGFYSFSKDEEERAKQMEELKRIRKLTEAARAQTTQTSADKQSALEARLKKVRDRKRQKLGLPPLSIRSVRLMGV